MKKILVLLALLSFTLGLNATVTKEDIYNANTEQFESLKKELATLNKTQSEKLKKVFLKKQFNEAFKKILSSKEIMNNSSYAVIKDGKIVEISNEKEAGGILFWHEHSPAVANPPGENVCLIQNPTWENTNLDSPCGVIKYQMLPDSSYAQITNFEVPMIYLLPSYQDELFQWLLDQFDEDTVSNTDPLDNLTYYAIHRYYDFTFPPERLAQFLNHQVVTDIVASAGYTYRNDNLELNFFVKPYGPSSATPYPASIPYVYEDTEFVTRDNFPIITLKTGKYAYFLVSYYPVGEYWWDGIIIVMRWFYLDVQNQYIDGVGVQNKPVAQANITWNNNQVVVDLPDSINPSGITCTLYDVLGKKVQQEYLSARKTTFPVSVSSGTYIVNLKGKNISFSKKIVIKK